MLQKFNTFLDVSSDFLAGRKGLIPMIGLLLILTNAVLQFYPGSGLLVETNLLLHLGIILAILGFMLAWAL
jgi:hypothetical protein